MEGVSPSRFSRLKIPVILVFGDPIPLRAEVISATWVMPSRWGSSPLCREEVGRLGELLRGGPVAFGAVNAGFPHLSGTLALGLSL